MSEPLLQSPAVDLSPVTKRISDLESALAAKDAALNTATTQFARECRRLEQALVAREAALAEAQEELARHERVHRLDQDAINEAKSALAEAQREIERLTGELAHERHEKETVADAAKAYQRWAQSALAAVTRERETAQDSLTALREATATILRGFDEGVFVRSVDGDHLHGWAIRLMPFVAALGKAQSIIGSEPPREKA